MQSITFVLGPIHASSYRHNAVILPARTAIACAVGAAAFMVRSCRYAREIRGLCLKRHGEASVVTGNNTRMDQDQTPVRRVY
jgi:hypothetical protein